MEDLISMPQYLFTDQTKCDLIQIRLFTVERWGNIQSVRYLRDLRKTLRLLSEMPSMGTACFDDLGENIYRFPFSRHVIYYQSMPNEKIVVVAILHQHMVPEKHFCNRL